MYINTFQCKPENVDCKLCSSFSKTAGCTAKVCPQLVERMEAGMVGYEEAVQGAFAGSPRLGERLHTAICRFPGSLFFNAGHRQRMERVKIRTSHRCRGDTPACLAAMYLLTANQDLDSRAEACFRHDRIEFSRAVLKDISPHNYTLLSAARDIYEDNSGIALSDLANGEVVDTLAFSLIVNALLIARYGCAALGITERSAP